VHRLRDRDRDEDVFAAPDQERGCTQLWEAKVEQIVAIGHRLHAATDDPAIALQTGERGAGDEGRELLRVGLKHLGEMEEARGIGRGEERGLEGGGKVDACAVVEDEAVDEFGMVEGEPGCDPAAHGPAANIGFGNVEGLEKLHDELFLEGNRVVDVGLG